MDPDLLHERFGGIGAEQAHFGLLAACTLLVADNLFFFPEGLASDARGWTFFWQALKHR